MNSLKIFDDMKTILDKHNIAFWLDSGTLLGIVRDKKIIEWDDDIDLAIMYTNSIRFLLSELYELGYNVFISDSKLTIRRGKEHLSVYFYHIRDIVGKKYITRYKVSKRDRVADIIQYVFLETILMPFKDMIHNPSIIQWALLVSKSIVRKLPFKEHIFRWLISYGVKHKHFERYTVDIEYPFLFDFKKVDFYHHKVNIPKYPNKYLEVMYGKKWNIPDKKWNRSWDFFELMKSRNQKSDLLIHLNLVASLLNKHNIHFWMYGGALLGYVRNNDLIPWDNNDVDLFVWKEDYPKLLALKKTFKKIGFKVLVKEKSLDLRWKEMHIGFQYNTLNGSNAYVYDRLVTNNRFGNIVYFGILCKISSLGMKKTKRFLKWFLIVTNGCYIVTQVVPAHFFLKLKEIDFFGVKLKVPSNTKKYLEYTFGKDWKTPNINFKRPTNYYVYGGLPDSKYRKYYKAKQYEKSSICTN